MDWGGVGPEIKGRFPVFMLSLSLERLDKRLEEARRAKTEREAESILDECTVALVLTSLSSSPTSWDSSSRQGTFSFPSNEGGLARETGRF